MGHGDRSGSVRIGIQCRGGPVCKPINEVEVSKAGEEVETQGWKEEMFDLVLQYLRTALLRRTFIPPQLVGPRRH